MLTIQASGKWTNGSYHVPQEIKAKFGQAVPLRGNAWACISQYIYSIKYCIINGIKKVVALN